MTNSVGTLFRVVELDGVTWRQSYSEQQSLSLVS